MHRPQPPQHPNTRSARWGFTGVGLGLALALITQAPAHWLTQTIEHLSGERMLLQDPQGTVWQGSAQWVLNEGPLNTTASSHTAQLANTTALPTRVTWQLGPRVDFAHLRLALSATLATACCTPEAIRVDLFPLWRGMRLSVADHTSHWPAAWLVGLGAPWNTVQPEGQLQLATTNLQWSYQAGQTQLQGQAELQLQQLTTRLSTLRPLGSYRLRVQGGEAMTLSLDTLEGGLNLQGTGQWQNGHVQFNGEASAAPDAQAALSNLLNILGSRQGAKSILKMG